MMRPPSFDEILFIIKNGWHDLINTDFDQLKYSAVDFAVKVGMVAAMIVLLKLTWILLCKIFGWHKYSRTDSGHTVSRDSERGFLAGFFLILPKIALLAPLTAILFAVADPFLATIKEEKKYVEVKTIVKLRDASGSMGYKFKQSGKSKGEIAMNADLKFLEMTRTPFRKILLWTRSCLILRPMTRLGKLEAGILILGRKNSGRHIQCRVSDTFRWTDRAEPSCPRR